MAGTLVSLGANLGNVHESMRAAKRLLEDSFGSQHLSFSHLYRTAPVGGPDGQGDFLNAVAAIQTQRSVWDVWDTIKQIETNLGRLRQVRWEARRIDIDLLLYDQQRIWTPHLKIPHPRMCMRTFVLKPALEIVPEWIDPVTNWSISKLNEHLDGSRAVDSIFRVICDSPLQARLLNKEFDRTTGGNQLKVQWDVAVPLVDPHVRFKFNKPESMPDMNCKLTIAAVASPDPMTVLWEDFSAPWAEWLNLDSRKSSAEFIPQNVVGPRYLMPANDSRWAIHEIMAAKQAMQCPCEIDGTF